MSQTEEPRSRAPLIQPPPTSAELPLEDGEPMDTHRHREQLDYLVDTLNLHWAERDDFFVGGNMFLYFSLEQTRGMDFRGPDVLVVTGIERRERQAWVVWEEGGRVPDVLIELLSESTEREDRGPKFRVYEGVLRIPELFLYDPFSADLEGYRHGGPGSGYRRIEPNAEGLLTSASLGLDLGVWRGVHHGLEAPWLRWYDGGELVPSGEERIAAAEARAAAAEARQRAAEAREREAEAREREAEAREREAEARLAAYEARFGPLDRD